MPSELATLPALITASAQALGKCIDKIEHQHSASNVDAATHLYFLRFDGNGKPMLAALAEAMYQHIIDYCLAARERPTVLTTHEAAKLTKKARKLFVHPEPTEDDPDQTGEAGELLLYLLIEIVLGAPQVVAKMDLKTNPNLEINGSDGIHMAWNQADGLVDLFFGEAKLYRDMGAAIKAALKSIDGFHSKDICRHEMLMVTQHFKHARQEVRAAVRELLEDGVPNSGVRVNHACLIGYNWAAYKAIMAQPAETRLSSLKNQYLDDIERIHQACSDKLESFSSTHVRLTFFFLPFESVQEFRDAFNAALD
jgi:hypothetical protein